MSDESVPPQFPQYQPPQGLPVADPKLVKPLYKLMKNMLRLKSLPNVKRTRTARKKKMKFY